MRAIPRTEGRKGVIYRCGDDATKRGHPERSAGGKAGEAQSRAEWNETDCRRQPEGASQTRSQQRGAPCKNRANIPSVVFKADIPSLNINYFTKHVIGSAAPWRKSGGKARSRKPSGARQIAGRARAARSARRGRPAGRIKPHTFAVRSHLAFEVSLTEQI